MDNCPYCFLLNSLLEYAGNAEESNFNEADRKFLEAAFTYLKTPPEARYYRGPLYRGRYPSYAVNISSPINPTDAGLSVKPKTLFANEGLSAEAGTLRTPVKKKAEPEDENSDVY
ncbi:hypothetical protein QBC39DRAFT_327237 [Podospora conica]|nr:hypothetical protein QBC39DRAFT_327237 [Schizothecium conicum]